MFEGFSERMTFMNPPLLKTSLSFVKTRQHQNWINLFVWTKITICDFQFITFTFRRQYSTSTSQNEQIYLLKIFTIVVVSPTCVRTKVMQLRPPLSLKFCSSLLKTLDYVEFQQWPLLYRTAQLSLLSFSLWKNL